MSRILSLWKKKNKTRAFLGFLLPSLAGVGIFVILPFLDVVRRSFLVAVTGKWNGIRSYLAVFRNEAFLLAVKNTFRFGLTAIPLLVILGLLLALPLYKLTGIQKIKSLYLFPMAIPTATVVLVWKLVFYQQGFLNLALTKVGEITGWYPAVTIDYLGTDASFWVLVTSYLWKNMGYTLLLWLAGLAGISPQIREAAKVDGAGGMQSFFYIVLPNLKGSLYTIVILSFLNSFKIYREAYLVAGSYPQDKIYLLQHLFNNWFVNMEFDKMAAGAVCTGGFLFLFILLLQRVWDRE